MSDVSNKANAKSSLEIGLYTGERTALMKKGLGSGFILGGTGLVHRGEPDAGDHQGRPYGCWIDSREIVCLLLYVHR